MHQTGGGAARVARWGGVLLGALLFACGPAPEDRDDAREATVPRPAVDEALPLAPHEKPDDPRDAAAKSSGVSNPFDLSRPSLRTQPTANAGVGVAFDGKQYFVVWEDDRDGGVFGSRVKNGRLLDPAGIPLNQGTGLEGGEPRVAWDGKQFVVVWVSGSGVFGAHVESDGDVKRHFILASSDEVFGPPGIACTKGLCLVAYVVSGDEEDLVVFDRVESDGDVRDGEILSELPGFAFRPAVAWDGKQFAVVWQDRRGGEDAEDLYGARVKKDGTVLDAAGGVPVITLPGAQRNPDLTWTGDRFLLVWQDDRGGTEDIYGARVRRELTLYGPEGFPISTGPGDQTLPHVAPSGSKSLVVWDDTRLGPHRVRGARVGDDGVVWDVAGFTISSSDQEEELQPAVAVGDHQFFVAYAGAESGTPLFGPHHILGTRVQHDKTVKDSPALLFTRSAFPQDQVAAAEGGGVYLTVWREVRDGVSRLLGARVRPDGRVLDVPFSFPAGPDAREPAVAWDGDIWMVVWEEGDEFGGGTGVDIRGARVSGAGVVLDAASLDIAGLPDDQYQPAIASNMDDFFVVWTDRRGAFFGNDSDIVGTRVSSGGVVLDPGGIPISSVPFTQRAPSVVATGDLRYLVAWVHIDFISVPAETERSIRGARVDADGNVLDAPERLFAEGPAFTAPPGLAWNGTNTLVAWTSESEGSFGAPGPAVLAVRVDADGDVLEAMPRVVATGGGSNRLNVTATFDGTDFWLAWEQQTDAPFFPALVFRTDVYGARVRANGTVRDAGGRVIAAHQPEPESAPALVSALGGRVAVFYTEFVTEEDVMNLRIQGRVLTGLGASATEVGTPAPAAAR
ncbi:hypothetical protein [Pyxidicoccus sp. MSG2]|uniref:hypothetical protein n=1 Tax=Pyxidicoccus sp. MSG2 TaxID=2996790 RepID=UPI002270B552|nr:hypothetical protein [Pyxidicoccus sp. MSG2]MCY1021028.1 hypothetical protein [Pyxidicoccus sp. MSG2]